MIDLSVDLVFACGLYVVALLVIGVVARQAQRGKTLSDYFLAGRSIGFWVLLVTFFATQYSGNSFSGLPGQTYREGLAYFMSVTFMVGIVVGYTFFAPRLFALSRVHRFVTPTDYLDHRYGSRTLNYLSAAIFVLALCNFLLAQLIALGSAFAELTDGRIPYAAVVVVGGLVVLAYQVMGGMRAVAWSDLFQGALVITGLVLVVILVWIEIGSPASVVRTVHLLRPDLVENPDWETSFVWLSNVLLLAFGAPLYPQAIQRIFAARRLRDLRRTLATMAAIPLAVATTVIFIGAAGIALFPQLDRFAADQITFRVVTYLLESNPLAYYPALMVILAVVAAIMSTADSCLLSVSSILTRDVVARIRGLGPTESDRLTGLAPVFSIVVMGALMAIAMQPLTTLWGLLVIKFELLIQLSPAFVLGTLHDRENARAFAVHDILAGITTGLAVTIVLYLAGLRNVYGLHAGTVGVVVNYAVVVGMRARRLKDGVPQPRTA